VGNAVARNRIKRLLRAWFRLHHHELEDGWDLVVIARRPREALGLQEVERQLGEFVVWINRRSGRRPAQKLSESASGSEP
jgi:ribonuclease P protein component